MAAPATEDKASQLDEIVVTAQKDELAKKTPAVVETRTAEDFKKVNIVDSADLFKQMPSVHMRKLYPGSTNRPLAIRANPTFATARTLVLMDGAVISNFLGASSSPRWQMTSPDEIERIDIIYGPFSASYSGNSLGGTALITTRMPTKREISIETGYNFQKSREYKSKDDLNGVTAHLSYGDKKGDLAYALWYDHIESDAQPISFVTALASSGGAPSGNPATGYATDTDPEKKRRLIFGSAGTTSLINDSAKLKLAYDLDSISQLRMTLGFWDASQDYDSPETYLRDSAGQPLYSGTFDIDGKSYKLDPSSFNYQRTEVQDLMYALNYTRKPSEGLNLDFGFSYFDILKDHAEKSSGVPPASKKTGPGTITDNQGGWYTLDLKASQSINYNGKHNLGFGYHFDHYDVDNEIWNATNWKSDSSRTTLSKGDKGQTRTNAIFLEDNWDISELWSLYLGGRCEWWKGYDGIKSTDALAGRVTTELPDKRDQSFSPKAAVSFKPAKDWSIRYSLGTAKRFPTIGELYYGGISAAGISNDSNPNLKAESTLSSDLTFTKTFDWFAEARLSLFQNDVEDAIWSQTNSYTNIKNYQNVDEVRTRGVEVAMDIRKLPIDGLRLNASFTWANSEILRNTNVPLSEGKTFPRVPQCRAKIGLDYEPSERWFCGMSANYSSRPYNTLENTDKRGGYGGNDDYLVVDAKAGYKITPQLTATLGVDNLGDELYHEFHPFPRRTFFFNLKYVISGE